MKESSWKDEEDWFERVRNTHTPFSTILTPPLQLSASVQLGRQKNINM